MTKPLRPSPNLGNVVKTTVSVQLGNTEAAPEEELQVRVTRKGEALPISAVAKSAENVLTVELDDAAMKPKMVIIRD